MQLYHMLAEEDGAVRTFPDGRPILRQPLKLLHAFRVIRRFTKIAEQG